MSYNVKDFGVRIWILRKISNFNRFFSVMTVDPVLGVYLVYEDIITASFTAFWNKFVLDFVLLNLRLSVLNTF